MELKWSLGAAGLWITLAVILHALVHSIEGKTSIINMFDKCDTYNKHGKNIKVDDKDTVYLNIDGHRWYNAKKCQITFKADDKYDDLQIKYTKYEMNECGVKVQVWSSSQSTFYGSPDASYSCSNVPLTNWKSTMNRYVKIVITRDFTTSTDFTIRLRLSVQDYNSDIHSTFDSSNSMTKLIAGSVVGVIIIIISIVILIICCRCMKSRQGGNRGTVYRQQYQAAPPTTQTSTTTADWVPPSGQHVQPSAPYPTLPTYPQQQTGYPYGYGQGQPLLEPSAPGYAAVPPGYPGGPSPGYPGGPPGYPPGQPGQAYPIGHPAPGYPLAPPAYPEPSAPPGILNQPPPPYPGLEETSMKQ